MAGYLATEREVDKSVESDSEAKLADDSSESDGEVSKIHAQAMSEVSLNLNKDDILSFKEHVNKFRRELQHTQNIQDIIIMLLRLEHIKYGEYGRLMDFFKTKRRADLVDILRAAVQEIAEIRKKRKDGENDDSSETCIEVSDVHAQAMLHVTQEMNEEITSSFNDYFQRFLRENEDTDNFQDIIINLISCEHIKHGEYSLLKDCFKVMERPHLVDILCTAEQDIEQIRKKRTDRDGEKEEGVSVKVQPKDECPGTDIVASSEDDLDEGNVDIYKSPKEFKEEVRGAVEDFRTSAKGKLNMLRSIVLCTLDFAIAVVGKDGCRLGFSDESAILDIPEGALDSDKIIYMHRVRESGCSDNIFSYSSIVRCGPNDTSFNKTATAKLRFDHYAVEDEKAGFPELAVFRRDNKNDTWVRQTNSTIIGKRAELCLEGFCEFQVAVEGDAPTLHKAMCIMLTVIRDRRQNVEVAMMQDERSLIMGHRNNRIHHRHFQSDEVHIFRPVTCDPSQDILFEGDRFKRVERKEIWTRGQNVTTLSMLTSRVGDVKLIVSQGENRIANFTITEQGAVTVEPPQIGSSNFQEETEPVQISQGLAEPPVTLSVQVQDGTEEQIAIIQNFARVRRPTSIFPETHWRAYYGQPSKNETTTRRDMQVDTQLRYGTD